MLLIDADPQGSALDWGSGAGRYAFGCVLGLPRPTVHKEIGTVGYGYDDIIIDGPPRNRPRPLLHHGFGCGADPGTTFPYDVGSR